MKLNARANDTERDLCWLSFSVAGKISQYVINDCGGEDVPRLHRTLTAEMARLFPESKEHVEQGDLYYEASAADLGEGYELSKDSEGRYHVRASREKGYLYGMFALYSLLRRGEDVGTPVVTTPSQHIRMVDHWDNFDGSIERGYAGGSIFYENGHFRMDYQLIREYARLLCSIGINAISINNVNVHHLESFFIEDPALVEIRKIADIFGDYGIRLFLSINFAAPITVGRLETADPLDPTVQNWWKRTVDGIYDMIPDFAGFLVKADSEGEPGPFAYDRTHADGANMLARALAPHGGIVIWRCFVYNCQQSWRDRSLDRANAAYDIFSALDGSFDDNVALQIKNGPIDFQIREPVSPLFGALRKTNQILEFQITQEYTGHQIDVCYLVPLWKEVLDFDTKQGGTSVVKDLLQANSVVPSNSGIAAVVNVGMDNNWTGNKLAQANLYGYGRLCWNNDATSEEIAADWVRLTFSLDDKDQEGMTQLLVTSRETYEDYTCPLAVGFMCKPGFHYGVDIDGYEYDRWGTYHYADRNGVGRERSLATGTGFTRKYSDARFEEYESLATCPDELLLFLHHVAYDHVLHSGKTLIQHIYDAHFEGVEKVEKYLAFIKTLEGKIPAADYDNILHRMELQLQNAIDWRDEVNTYFLRKSGIGDSRHRTIYE